LMSHTTGPLRQVLHELVLDEINHMTKFWGFGLWAYPDSYTQRLVRTLRKCLLSHLPSVSASDSLQQASHVRSTIEITRTFDRMKSQLSWHQWTLSNRCEMLYTFAIVMYQLLTWSNSLNRTDLNNLFGGTPCLP
jgi:hypothetical protein